MANGAPYPHTAYRRSEWQAMYAKFEAEIEK